LGRSFDIVHGKNGNKVSGTFWTLSFRNSVQGVEAFQVRQDRDYSLRINVKTNSLFTIKEKEKIKLLIKDKLGDNHVEIAVVNQLEKSPSGVS